ncbi:outer membrane beta-barrel protein [Marinobacter sp. chi1]|uniref:Outer membrane beta-barrel protein n=1 Tax=Marinobacter suaedae TaxID=3057675 RepID=A0ABT8W3K2_9GAMM|nr:outer membrane beta-barrel protein [Marinobacter sp. chi1]MDO3722821.1 outer membrane beta-barrel protein [Marinobacter sp. chi1]
MKKVLIASAIASALAAAPVSAQEGQNTVDYLKQDGYFKALIGFADLGLDDAALAVTGTYGKRLPQVHPNFRFEADLGLSLSDAESSYNDGFGNRVKTSASYFLLGGYGVYEHPLDNKLSVYGRGGLVYVSSDVEVKSAGLSRSGSDSSIELGIGAGGKYQYTPKTAFIVDLSKIDDYEAFSVGAQFEF